MGVEIAHDDQVSILAEKCGEFRCIIVGAAGAGGDVHVDNVEWRAVGFDGDTLMLNGGVAREEMTDVVGPERGGVINQHQQSSASSRTRAVPSDGVVAREGI